MIAFGVYQAGSLVYVLVQLLDDTLQSPGAQALSVHLALRVATLGALWIGWRPITTPETLPAPVMAPRSSHGRKLSYRRPRL